jgi:hypothetical protein
VHGQLQRTKKPQQIRGLNQNHNHEMKEIFKGAATRASCGVGPPWQWSVALQVDRILESSSRPPSSRAFLVGTVKSTRLVARPTSLCHQLSPARAGPTPCADNLRASDHPSSTAESAHHCKKTQRCATLSSFWHSKNKISWNGGPSANLLTSSSAISGSSRAGLALSFSGVPPVTSPRLSRASKDGCSTENDVHLSTDP